MEMHPNKTTREWVIYPPNRGKRSQNFQQEHIVQNQGESNPSKSPFCNGNEHLLRPIILERKNPENTNWQIGLMPNKFPPL